MAEGTCKSESIGVLQRVLMVLLGASGFSLAQSPPSIDPAKAQAAFVEAQELSAKDNGRLWGKPLYGPMLFVDPATRAAVANGPDVGGVLHPDGGVYVGVLPKDVVVANTAVEWQGKRWTMVMWPLPQNSQPRDRLLAHELFHRLQPDLSIPLANPENAQLDTLEGRVWLQLEWRALAVALVESGAAQTQAIRDALAFATHRHELFPGSAETERSLTLNEGLAEYTGVAASAPDAASGRWRAITRLTSPEADTFVRSFAYASGPAYGLLLDERLPGWRSQIKSTSDLTVRARRDCSFFAGRSSGTTCACLWRSGVAHYRDRTRCAHAGGENAVSQTAGGWFGAYTTGLRQVPLHLQPKRGGYVARLRYGLSDDDGFG